MNYKKYRLIATSIIGILLFASCSDDEAKIVGEQKVYLSTKVLPVDFMSQIIELTPVSVPDKMEFKIPVHITAPLTSDITITAELDEMEAVTVYNETNGTSYEMPVDGTYSLTQNKVVIKAGEYKSSEDLCLTISNFKSMNSSGNYLFPVILKDVSNGNAVLSTNLNRMYCAITNTFNNVDPENTEIEGATYADRNGWPTPRTNAGERYSLPDLFDGDTDTAWEPWSYSTIYLKLDFNKPLVVKGIAMNVVKNYYGYYTNIKTVYVYSSEDNENWIYQGKKEFPIPFSKDDVNIIKFYSPVETQYIKLDFPDSYYYLYSEDDELDPYISELNIIE